MGLRAVSTSGLFAVAMAISQKLSKNIKPVIRLLKRLIPLDVTGNHAMHHPSDLNKAALCGEPSYVWRAGQERRLQMIRQAAGKCLQGRVLENGCGVGMYVKHLTTYTNQIIGLEYDFERAKEAHRNSEYIVNAAGENLPFPQEKFDLILSHEVLEHTRNDRTVVTEMIRVLQPGGRIVLFVPNRGYPFETHGIYWRGEYRFGNIPLVNYLPRGWRDRLAPHVRVYNRSDLEKLFTGLPVRFVERRIIFGAYDNIIARKPRLGQLLRKLLQFLEKTPLQGLGLSHFWVIEKTPVKEVPSRSTHIA